MPSLSQRPFVLLVEDSEDVFFCFQRVLRRAGFGGQPVNVGVSALVFLDLKVASLSTRA